MFLSTSYFVFIVPFQLALEYDIIASSNGANQPATSLNKHEPRSLQSQLLVADLLFNLVFCVDIFFRLRLAYVENERGESDIERDIDRIQSYYVNKILIYDIFAAIPFDYLLLPCRVAGLQVSDEAIRFLRILKFLKLKRVMETITIMKKHSSIPNSLITFTIFFILYVVLAHLMATSYIFIGKREVGKKNRFDGQTMFSDVTSRNFITPDEAISDKDFEYLKPTQEMTKLELYIQFIYLSSCTMGAVMYGDIIPYTMNEQMFDFIAMFTCRIFLAFLFAEAASFLSSIHKSASEHTKRVRRISRWSDSNHLPGNLKRRILKFYEILWKNFQGVRQQNILQDLPESLRQDVRQYLFKTNIENWDVIVGNKDNGVVSSFIQKLELRIIPQDEFIIKYGEVAQEMYFIVKGQVDIISSDGIHLAQIGPGQNFGEMALLQEGNTRNATAQAATDVTMAIMQTEDFKKICDLYPSFRENIMKVVEQRKKENKDTIVEIVNTLKLTQMNRFDWDVVDQKSLSSFIEDKVFQNRLSIGSMESIDPRLR